MFVNEWGCRVRDWMDPFWTHPSLTDPTVGSEVWRAKCITKEKKVKLKKLDPLAVISVRVPERRDHYPGTFYCCSSYSYGL